MLGVTSPRTIAVVAVYDTYGGDTGREVFDEVGGNNDVHNGNCAAGQTPAYFCNAVQGYDGPTGLGTPNGYRAL